MSDHGNVELTQARPERFVVLVALVDERGVTRAATRLHMRQAAVSTALGRLRRMFDDVLFTRVPGVVAPTLRSVVGPADRFRHVDLRQHARSQVSEPRHEAERRWSTMRVRMNC
jgi:hypothetical protein